MNRISVAGDVGPAAAYLLLYLAVFIFSKWCWGFLAGCRLNEELVEKDNPAVALALCGYHLAVLAVFLGALWGETNGDLLTDLGRVGLWSLVGLIFINLSGRFIDIFILFRLPLYKDISANRNAAAGGALGGAFLATGLISAGAVSGEGGGLVSALVFFVLGQISLAVFARLYMLTLPFNMPRELAEGNAAAGLSFGGALAALGLIIMSSAAGSLVDWSADLAAFGLANALAFVFLPVLRWAGDRLIVPGRPLSLEIKEDRNLGAGLIQATALISFGALLAVLI